MLNVSAKKKITLKMMKTLNLVGFSEAHKGSLPWQYRNDHR